jgi:predicted dehydrogenase
MSISKVGIIGLGIGEQYILPCLELHLSLILCDQNPDKRQAIQTRYPDIQVVADADVILTDPDVDLVIIASWDDAHAEQILAALTQNKHVFVEKPLCLFESEARLIRAELKRKPSLHLGSNLILRKSPRFLELKNRIQKGEMGQIYYMEGDYNYGRLSKIVSGWRGQLPFYSIVLGGGVHLLDLLMWLSGERILSVVSIGNQIASANTEFRFPDFVVSLLTFENGLSGKMAVNFGCVHPHFHPLQIYGTSATFINHIDKAEWFTEREAPPEILTTAYPGVHKGALFRDFLISLQHDLPPPMSIDEVFASLSVCFAIHKALQSGQTISVDYI